MKRKNTIVAMLTLCAILFTVVVSFPAIAEEERETLFSGDYEYAILNDGSIEITFYTGDDAELTIPDTIDDRMVTGIGDYAFEWCYSLTSIKIPDSVTSIGDFAFDWCSSLTSITIPDSVTEMGANPFQRCENLTEIKMSPDQPVFATIDGVLFNKTERKLICYPYAFSASEYSIPNGIQSIGVYAFYGCYNLGSITIPDSVTSIGDEAFYGCAGLTSVTIPDSVTSIGDDAFSDCENLTSITIPDSVTSIGNFAFGFCSPLLCLTVGRDSYAKQYAIDYGIQYTYPDSYDWLNG